MHAVSTFQKSQDLAIHPYSSAKPLSIIERLAQSNLFKSALTAISLGGFLAAALQISSIPPALILTILGIGGIGLAKFIYSDRKGLLYEASLIPTIILAALNPHHYPWSQEILPGKLTLGAQPQLNKGHHKIYSAKGISCVLTLQEPLELTRKSIFTEPVQKHHWEALGVSTKMVITPDFEPVSQSNIEESVEWLNQNIANQSGHAYVHCKAGRGRSATIIICYLLKYGHKHSLRFSSVKEAIDFVKLRRPAININKHQRNAIEEYFLILSKKTKI